MTVARLDHLVLTVRNLEATIDFYTTVIGMRATTFGEGRHALEFGEQKINLHRAGHEFEPKAHAATPGSADLCFILAGTVDDALETLAEHGVPVLQGPLVRTGAVGTLRSVYFRDPDGNLIEVSEYIGSAPKKS
jgi:catechol 2,3-dioxygenase-like lactoylglutathione lyase family enzyme